MNILIYGSVQDNELLVQLIKSQASMAFRMVRYSHAEDYDMYINMLRNGEFDIVFVMTDNAAGMEGVIAVQNVQPDVPIVWFSNDQDFVAQSYRLGVAYFTVKPINEKVVNLALTRCQRN